jgi:hypothetical protein
MWKKLVKSIIPSKKDFLHQDELLLDFNSNLLKLICENDRGKLQKSSRSELIELTAQNANAVLLTIIKHFTYISIKKNEYDFPKEQKYAKTDEWVKVEGEMHHRHLRLCTSQLGDMSTLILRWSLMRKLKPPSLSSSIR